MPFGERAWTRQDMAELLASPGVAGLLLQVEGADAGLAICRVAADEAELITIAVRRLTAAAARRGACWRRSSTMFARRCQNPVPRSRGRQSGGPEALQTTGFRVAGSRPAYFRRGNGPAADAVVMRLDLS